MEEPVVCYGGGPDLIHFATADGRWSRVTFEKLDAIRVSRGEWSPYPPGQEDAPRSWVSVVEDSPWLRERHAYEKLHYAGMYEYGGDVDAMLTEYSHYLFRFHDQFVEALCGGVWFEVADQYIGDREAASDHPFLDLPAGSESGTLTAHGLTCRIRRNPRSIEQLVADAALCSQKLLQFVLELDGAINMDWTLSIRARGGRVRSYLHNGLGTVATTHEGIATLEDVRPHVEAWLRGVRDRRSAMGKE